LPTLLISGGSPSRLAAEALRVASGILCPGHADPRSCGVCRRIAEGSHPDFLRVGPDGIQIKVDAAREAIRFASGRPYEAAARVVWIESAEALREGAAANALLKSLEEPGGFLTWVLTTTAPDAILGTIRSRCEQRRLPRRSAEERKNALARRLPPADVEDALAFEADERVDFDLDRARELRRAALASLAAGATSSLLELAAVAAEEDDAAPLVAALLRDAAVLAAGGSPDRLRHRAAAGELAAVARVHPVDALRRAAVEVDALPDGFQRALQKRLAWEKALLELSPE
jgi:DNA polymerase-3 subunit delta'